MVLQVSISSYEYLIPAGFCRIEQLAAAELRLTALIGSLNTMVVQRAQEHHALAGKWFLETTRQIRLWTRHRLEFRIMQQRVRAYF